MTRVKKTIMAAIAVLALSTASLAVPGQAFAGGHGHGGHHGGHGGHGGHGHHGHGHHGHHGHGHFGHGHRFYVYNSCWKWSPYGPINVCRRY